MSNLDISFTEYFIYFYEVVELWRSLHERSPVLLWPLFNQTEQLRLCSRAQIDERLLLKFPDVKEKLLAKITLCIEEEMTSIVKVQQEIQIYSDGLQTRLKSIEKAYEKFDHNQEREFNPLIPAHGKLLEFAVDMWKCFHILWLGVKTSMESLDYFSEDSVKSISEAFTKFKSMEQHFEFTHPPPRRPRIQPPISSTALFPHLARLYCDSHSNQIVAAVIGA